MTGKTHHVKSDAEIVFAVGDQVATVLQAAAQARTSTVAFDGLDALMAGASERTRSAVLNEVAALAERYAVVVPAMLRDGVGIQPAVAHILTQLPAIFRAAVTASVDTGLREQLGEAEQHEATLHTEHTNMLAKLEAAIGDGDISAVTRLRPDVEITLPNQIDQAHLAVLDAKTALAEAEAQAAAPLKSEAERQRDNAASKVAQAQAALAEAHLAARCAETTVADLTSMTGSLRVAADNARYSRDNTAAQLATAHQRRFRRLAGLPDDSPNPSTQGAVANQSAPHAPTATFTVDPDFAWPEKSISPQREPVIDYSFDALGSRRQDHVSATAGPMINR